jgi:transposase-like protein
MSKSNNPAAARRGRDPSKESRWRKLLSLQDCSSLTVRAFCEREDLKETAFYFWRREIRRRDRQSADRQTPALSFVELHAAPMPVAVAATERACRDFGELSSSLSLRAEGSRVEPVLSEAPLELLLPGDRRLLIRAGCDGDLLARVVAVLAPESLSKGEGRSC